MLAGQERVLLKGRQLWGAVSGLSVDQLVAWGVLYYAYTVLSAPIACDLGVSRIHVAGAFSVCLFVAGWVGRQLGPVLDARGTRSSLRTGAIVAPVVFAAIAVVWDLASLFVAFALLGVVHALSLYEPAFRAVVEWCDDSRSRSRALLGLTVVGGFASTVFLPLTGWLLTRLDWRQSVLVLAAILAFVAIPTRFLLPLQGPRRGVERPPPSRFDVPRSARRLGAGLSLHAFASTGVSVYLMWHLVEQGESFVAATAIAGFAGAAQVPGRLLSHPLRGLFGGARFLPFVLGVQTAALLLTVLADGALATLGVVIFGAANGMMTLERATLLVEWYGQATFGSHQGRLAAASGTARAIAPFAVEVGHHFASYALVFGLLALVLALGTWSCVAAATFRASETGEKPTRRGTDAVATEPLDLGPPRAHERC